LELACFAPALEAQFDPAGMSYRLQATITMNWHRWGGASNAVRWSQKNLPCGIGSVSGLFAKRRWKKPAARTVWHRLCI